MVIVDLLNREKYNEIFASTVGNWDLFIPFIEIGLKLGNVSTFIIPNKLISQDYAKTIREMITDQRLIEIRDYSRQNVFPIADVYPITVLFKKKEPSELNYNLKITGMKNLIESENENVLSIKLLKEYPWDIFFLDDNKSSLLIDILDNQLSFSNYVNFVSPCTVSEAYLIKENLIDEIIKSNTKKLINSGTIDRYTSKWGDVKTQYIKSQYIYPTIHNSALRSINENRFQQSCQKKIIIANMTTDLEAFLDNNAEYLAGKSTVIGLGEQNNLLLITGLINSKLISFLYKSVNHSTKMKGGALSVTPSRISAIPIISNGVIEKQIIESVEKRLDSSEETISKEIENQIDILVYKLYNLTYDEVKVIDPEFQLSEAEYDAIK